jgi:TolB protein
MPYWWYRVKANNLVKSHVSLIRSSNPLCYNLSMHHVRRLSLLLLVFTLVWPTATYAAPAERLTGRIAFASTRTTDGNSDIFSTDIAGEIATNLTNNPAPDTTPAWSPDGTQIAFASRREQNWDLYLMQADGSGLTRLTDHPGYEGEPAWSPDGRMLAFTSSRSGNLDIFMLNIADGVVEQLTDNAAADYGPDWSPDGRVIAFTSWRDEQQEVYLLNLLAEQDGFPPVTNVSKDAAPDFDPAWSPDGRRLAFVSERENVYSLLVADFSAGTLSPTGPVGRSVRQPAWVSNDGLIAAGVWAGGGRTTGRQGVLIATPGKIGATYLVGSPHAYGHPSYAARAVAPNLPSDRSFAGRLLSLPVSTAEPPVRAEGFLALEGIKSGGRALLAADVMPSFQQLRRAVIAASGHDFLLQLSEATRPVDFQSSTASYTSWHKAGRAFDTLFNYSAGGRQVLYIVPEPLAGRLFWRLYLRAANQDGSQGAPLTQPVFQPNARTLLPPPSGYFVDFTAIAGEHGWSRIAAQERENFSWRSELLALEYWHFERRDGLSWYAAMALVHSESTLERLFNVETLIEAGSRPGFLSFLGLPWAPPNPTVTGPIVRTRGPR